MRVLVIGTGSIGQRHMHNLNLVSPHIEFLLLRRNKVVLDGWPEAIPFTDLEEALAYKPDLAIVASPSARHIDVLPTIIAAHVPAYVEKPIITTADQAATIRQALLQSAERRHYAGFNLRYLPSLQAAREAVKGRLGKIVRASFTAGQWLPDWRKDQDHRQSYSADASAGGGVLFDLSHEFDAARFLLGEIELLATEMCGVDALEIASEAVALAIGRTASGALVSITVDYVARKPIRRYEVVGTRGTLVWDLAAKSLTVTEGSVTQEVRLVADGFDVARTYERAMQDLVNTVDLNRPGDLQSLEDGLLSTDLPIRAHMLGAR